MQLDRLDHRTDTHALDRTPVPTEHEPRSRIDASGRTFHQVLVDITPPRHADDIDGNGVISDPERLVVQLRELAEQLALEALLRPGKVDPQRLQAGMARITQLADELAGRIEDRDPITREDLADISCEAIDIYQWACEPAEGRAADARDADNPAIDGHVDWRSDRPAADRAALRPVDMGGVDRPRIQRVTWVEGADARGALAERLQPRAA